MSEAAAHSRGDDEQDPGGVPENGDGCLDELRLSVADLHSATERSFALISQIVARGDRLSEGLVSTRKEFSVGTLFAEAVTRARESMQEIGDEAQCGLPCDENEDPESGLADFMSLYTMQSEIDVHEGVTKASIGTMDSTTPIEGQKPPPGDADEIGDNVEFF
jgi:hypothetical protein